MGAARGVDLDRGAVRDGSGRRASPGDLNDLEELSEGCASDSIRSPPRARLSRLARFRHQAHGRRVHAVLHRIVELIVWGAPTLAPRSSCRAERGRHIRPPRRRVVPAAGRGATWPGGRMAASSCVRVAWRGGIDQAIRRSPRRRLGASGCASERTAAAVLGRRRSDRARSPRRRSELGPRARAARGDRRADQAASRPDAVIQLRGGRPPMATRSHRRP